MKDEKFLKDTKVLLDFISIYCQDKHEEEIKSEKELEIIYNEKKLGKIKYTLCSECENNFLYSYERIQQCPHEEKPRCRKCYNPCYEKSKWKSLAQIMRYSGMKKGLTKIKGIFKKSDD